MNGPVNLVKEATWFTAVRLLGMAASWAITILVARVLLPDDYGLMAMAMVVIGLLDVINALGLDAAMIQKKDLGRRELEGCFWVSLLGSIASYAIVFLGAPLVALFFNDERVVPILRVVALTLVIAAIGFVSENMLMKTMSFKKKALTEFVSTLVSAGSAYVLAIWGWGVWSLVISSVCRTASSTAVSFALYPWFPSGGLGFGQLREMVTFGLNVVGARILWYCYYNADMAIVGRFLGEVALGYYNLAWSLATRPLHKLTSLGSQLSFPVFAFRQEDVATLQGYFLNATRYVCLVALPAMAGAIVVAPDFVDVVLTSKWSEITLPFQVLCAVAFLQSLGTVIPPLLNARGRAHENFRYTSVCTVVMPISLLVGVRFGLTGVALTWLAVYPMLFSYLLRLGLREIDLGVAAYMRALIPFAGATVVMVLAVLSVRSLADGGFSRAVLLLASILAGVGTYVVVLVAISPQARSDSWKLFAALRS